MGEEIQGRDHGHLKLVKVQCLNDQAIPQLDTMTLRPACSDTVTVRPLSSCNHGTQRQLCDEADSPTPVGSECHNLKNNFISSI
jgi:hypothetical protein